MILANCLQTEPYRDVDGGEYLTSYRSHSLEQEIKNFFFNFLYDGDGGVTVHIMLWECSRWARPLRWAVS